MNRESICKQQIHCLSCPLSVRITGKDCRTLTQREVIELKVKEFENTCIYCGDVLPEGRTVCPKCAYSEAEHFEKAMSSKIPQISHTEFKVDDVREQSFREGYIKGLEEGMKTACVIKQENEWLKRKVIILEQQANKTAHDIDAEYE